MFSLESNTILSDAVARPAGGPGEDPAGWIQTVHTAVQECLARLGEERKRLAGISVCGSQDGVALLGRDNQVLRCPRVRGKAAEQARCELGRRFGGRPGVMELLGRPLREEAAATGLYALKKEEPGALAEVSSVLPPRDFINFWLTGVKRSEYSGGSETGFMDVRRRLWREEVLREIDPRLPEMMPGLCSSLEVAGGLRPELAREWGVSDHLLVASGGSRAAMEMLGAGVINPGELLVNLAGAESLRVVLEEPVEEPEGELGLSCDGADQWMLSLERCRSGGLAREVKEQWGWDNGQFERVAASVPPGAGGLVYVSGGGGEGPGVLCGLDRGNLTSPNLARAAIEAVALELGRALDRMRSLGIVPARVKLVGEVDAGAGRRQLLADVFGMPVASAGPLASPAVGAALQAAAVFYHASGENLSYTELVEYALPVHDGDWSHPRQGQTRFYEELRHNRGHLEELMEGEERWHRAGD